MLLVADDRLKVFARFGCRLIAERNEDGSDAFGLVFVQEPLA